MPNLKRLRKELEEIQQELQTLQPDSHAYRALVKQKDAIENQLSGYKTTLQKNSATVFDEHNVNAGRDLNDSVIVAGNDNRVNINSFPHNAIALSPYDALCFYLDNIIATHQHLRFQGIRTGEPVSILLENVYISLRVTDQEKKRKNSNKGRSFHESSNLTISSALNVYRRLVVIGDPGCGKTTLLSYIALTYACGLSARIGSGMAGNQGIVQKRLGLNIEFNYLPVLLPLRSLGRHLKEEENCSNPAEDGPLILLDCLFKYYKKQLISLPDDFFSYNLETGATVLLLDGMDEVVDMATRQRVARIIELFTARYPNCRFVVTSREAGYEGAARIAAEFGLVKICEFSNLEVNQFVRDWTRNVETTLAGSKADEIIRLANDQAEKLIETIHNNRHIAELAVNPLMLTVIAIIHRYRTKLSGRRSELYEEAVDVLIGLWDAAKPGFDTEILLSGLILDGGDRRSLLEPLAFWLHENKKREFERDDLREILLPKFQDLLRGNREQAIKVLDDFLVLIIARSGLLIERNAGIYSFTHLSFQEYLAARKLAERDDALAYSIKVLSDPWWREVILLEAGYLSTQGTHRVSTLIRTISDSDPIMGAEPHHHLLLAAECLFEVGPARLEGNLLNEVKERLQKHAKKSVQKGNKKSILNKISVMSTLARIETGQYQVISQYWKQPWGEPNWVTIPAGKFWMGDDKSQYDDERPAHQVFLPEYQIARVPITNAQYALYLQDVKNIKVRPPDYWLGNSVPPGLENHPVVNVSWYDAMAYCRWLGQKIEKAVNLPSEAEWEKAAKGNREKRDYPWGNIWRQQHCNSLELGFKDTTPVGLFLNGESYYHLLDMSGNVWEWTRTVWNDCSKYPYQDDNKDDSDEELPRILRGGSFQNPSNLVRCTYRHWFYPLRKFRDYGFRIVMVSSM